jgi:ABC-type transporter Mla subunit MlaD
MSAGRDRQSAAAAAGERVRAVLEAAEQSAAELRAEAAEEIETQLAKAQAVAERLSTRADEIERALQSLAQSVREELSALKADLEELRAVGEGMATAREEAGERAEVSAAAADEPAEPPAEEEPATEVIAEEDAAPADTAPPDATPPDATPPPPAPTPAAPAGQEGARVIALNMALNGSSREDTAHYLSENFELDDPEALLDEVYSRVSG